jgi:hypothetical protein
MDCIICKRGCLARLAFDVQMEVRREQRDSVCVLEYGIDVAIRGTIEALHKIVQETKWASPV